MWNIFFLVHFTKLYTLNCLALAGIKVVSERTFMDTYLEHYDYCARLQHYVLPELITAYPLEVP